MRLKYCHIYLLRKKKSCLVKIKLQTGLKKVMVYKCRFRHIYDIYNLSHKSDIQGLIYQYSCG